jgi:hypothetical protein
LQQFVHGLSTNVALPTASEEEKELADGAVLGTQGTGVHHGGAEQRPKTN